VNSCYESLMEVTTRFQLFILIILVCVAWSACYKETNSTRDSRNSKASNLKDSQLQPFTFEPPVGTLPDGIQLSDIVRGFWFYYPHLPSPGKRFWLQVDRDTWIERYANGRETRFRLIGRLTVNGRKGSLLATIHGDPAVTKVKDDASFQVFVPDKADRETDALFRNLINGKWQSWGILGRMKIIK
jgi:hypothetical protein